MRIRQTLLAFMFFGASLSAAALEIVVGPPPSDIDTPAAIALRAFGTRDGLMHSRIYALAQDHEGFVWAGTEAGVARYDGRRWEAVMLPGNAQGAVPYINALAGVADGAMWIASDELGLFRYHSGSFQRFELKTAQDSSDILSLVPRDAESVWVGGSIGVAICTASGCHAIASTRGLNVFVVRPGKGPDGKPVLWIGTINDGLRRLDDLDAAEPKLADFSLTKADGLPASTIRSLAVWGGTDDNDLWIGTGTGLARVSGGQMTIYDRRNGMDTTTVASLVASRDVRGAPVLYAGLRRGGLAEIRADGSWQAIGTDRGLPDDNIISLLVTDPERPTPRLWMGSRSSGVLRRDSGLWSTIPATTGLPSGIISGVGEARFPDGKTRYWIGTADGSVRRDGGRWVALGPEPLARAAVSDATQSSDGNLWFATDLGLFRLDKNGVTTIDRGPVGLAGDPVIAVRAWKAADGVEEVWFGSRHGAGRVREGRVQLPPGDPPGWLRSHVVRAFADVAPADGPRELWIAGEFGIARLIGSRWETLPDGCLPHREVFDLRVNPHAPATELWAATRRGVTRIRTQPAIQCSSLSSPQLPGPMSYQVQFDQHGRVYVFGYQGVVRVSANAATSEIANGADIDYYDESDGLPALEFNRASMVDHAGRVWGGSIAGVAVYNPEDEPQAQAPKPLKLEPVLLDSAAAALVAGSELGPGRVELRFDYRLLSFEREHRTRYRTELVGLDEPPTAWSDQDSVTFSRLPPGPYRFRVWGRDDLGTVSGPLEFAFSIAKPYWQRPWALALYGFGLVLLGLNFVRLRTRSLARRAAHLEEQVTERTFALAEANDRLARASLTDPLTGLNNRRFFNETVAIELQQLASLAAKANRFPVRALCILDLDFFKQINDQHGHACGDSVLQKLADCLRTAAGENGVAMRWGGEEFLVILSLEDQGAAPAEAERLLDAVRQCRTQLETVEILVTASLGWALWPWDIQAPDSVNLDQVLTLADQALYRAKAAGRNRAIGAVCDPNAPPLPERPSLHVRWHGAVAQQVERRRH